MRSVIRNARGAFRSPGADSTVTYDSSTTLSSKVLDLTAEGDIDWIANIGASTPTRKRLGGRFDLLLGMGTSTGALSGWGFSSVSYSAGDIGTSASSGSIANGYYKSYTANVASQISFRLRYGLNVVRLYVSNALPFVVDASISGSSSTATVTTSAGSGNLCIQFTFDCKEPGGQIGTLVMTKTTSTGNLGISALTIGSA